MHTPLVDRSAWCVLMTALAVVAVVDIRQRRIPNVLVAPIAIGGIAYAAFVGGGWAALAALVGLVAGVALLYLPFAKGAMGAGDVKLLGALGAWAGALGAVWILLIGAIVGGVLSVAALARLGRSDRAEVGRNVITFATSGGMLVPEPSQISRARGVPFGVALAIAGAVVTFMGAGR